MKIFILAITLFGIVMFTGCTGESTAYEDGKALATQHAKILEENVDDSRKSSAAIKSMKLEIEEHRGKYEEKPEKEAFGKGYLKVINPVRTKLKRYLAEKINATLKDIPGNNSNTR